MRHLFNASARKTGDQPPLKQALMIFERYREFELCRLQQFSRETSLLWEPLQDGDR